MQALLAVRLRQQARSSAPPSLYPSIRSLSSDPSQVFTTFRKIRDGDFFYQEPPWLERSTTPPCLGYPQIGPPVSHIGPPVSHICLLYTSPSPRDRTRS
eukprot:50047-Hanusia_phi.AAC.1